MKPLRNSPITEQHLYNYTFVAVLPEGIVPQFPVSGLHEDHYKAVDVDVDTERVFDREQFFGALGVAAVSEVNALSTDDWIDDALSSGAFDEMAKRALGAHKKGKTAEI